MCIRDSLRGMSVLAGLLWLASCSSSPKSRDYPGYMTRPYPIRGHRYQPMNVERCVNSQTPGAQPGTTCVTTFFHREPQLGV